MTTHLPVVIIGAGISGLVCAHALRQSGVDALLVESSDRPGGLIRSEQRDGFLLELGPQSFTGTPQLLDLCRDLGIEDQLLTTPPRAPRYLLIEGELRQAPLSPPAFFTSWLFSARTKWSVLRDAFGRSIPPDADESVAAFVRRKFSSELLDKLVGPFVSGIYAGDPEKLSLRASFPQLYEAERTSGSIIRGMIRAAKSKPGPRQRPTLQTFRHGNETLITAVVSKLGTALRTESTVTEIRRVGSGEQPQYELALKTNSSQDRLTPRTEEKLTARSVVLATPTNSSVSLLRAIQPDFAPVLECIGYAPVAVVSLGYSKAAIAHSLEGFGFLAPRSAGLRTLGAVWNSSLFPGRAPTGQVLLTSFVGGASDPAAVTLSPEQLTTLVHKEIAPLLHISQAPSFSSVTLYPRALPQYNLGHSQRLASLEKLRKQHAGLWFVGNYLRGPSIGACVEEALSVAGEIRDSFSKSRSLNG